MRQKTVHRWIHSIFRILIIACISIFIYSYREQLQTLDLINITEAIPNTAFTIAIIWAVYAAKAVLFVIPAMLIYVSVGAMFPFWQAAFINLVGLAIEIIISYYFGRFLGGENIIKIFERNRNGKKLLSNINGQAGVCDLFIVRFLPAPIDLTSLFLGAINIPFLIYLTASLAGIYPRVAFFTIFGDWAQSFLLQRKDISPGVTKFIVTAIICILIVYYFQNRRKHKNAHAKCKEIEDE